MSELPSAMGEPLKKIVKPSALKNTQQMLDLVRSMLDLPINFRAKPTAKSTLEA
jgi:hypothetical protein